MAQICPLLENVLLTCGGITAKHLSLLNKVQKRPKEGKKVNLQRLKETHAQTRKHRRQKYVMTRSVVSRSCCYLYIC